MCKTQYAKTVLGSRVQSMLSDCRAKPSLACLSFSARQLVLDVLGSDVANKFLEGGWSHTTPNVLVCFTYQMSDLMDCYRTFPNLPKISSTVKKCFELQHFLKAYGASTKTHSGAPRAAIIKFNKRPAEAVCNVCQDLQPCKPYRSLQSTKYRFCCYQHVIEKVTQQQSITFSMWKQAADPPSNVPSAWRRSA